MSDDVQTVQTDYAEAMEMLYRQQQTIKKLRAENARLREALKQIHDAVDFPEDTLRRKIRAARTALEKKNDDT